MTGAVPPLGRCALCQLTRALSAHTSARDGLKRLLCTPCYSHASLAEEAGHVVDWAAGHQVDAAEGVQRWLEGAS
jgi:hypothetical protein